ncbi:hypothetical protein KC345_g11803, partial [Hortaea werneckii]
MTCSTNSSTNTLLTDYFGSPNASPKQAVNVFNSMQEDLRINRSYSYVRRLIVTDNNGKFLQVDNSGTSVPLTIHNIGQITGLNNDAVEEWDQVIKDPLSASNGIPFVFPVYGRGAVRVGTVYLLANTSVITDKLRGYSLPEHSRLLLTLGNHHYQLIGDQVTAITTPYEPVAYTDDKPVGPQTELSMVRLTDDEESHIVVSYPVRSGVILSQTLSGDQFAPKANIWILVMLGVVLLVILLSAIITLYLTRTISLPVEKLKKRIDKIAQGNFLIDRNIEWKSELGDVGRGINRLSQDIVALMDSRLADEK